MTIKEITGIVNGQVFCCEERLNGSVEYVNASVLTCGERIKGINASGV